MKTIVKDILNFVFVISFVLVGVGLLAKFILGFISFCLAVDTVLVIRKVLRTVVYVCSAVVVSSFILSKLLDR